jgi:hypothetical protein
MSAARGSECWARHGLHGLGQGIGSVAGGESAPADGGTRSAGCENLSMLRTVGTAGLSLIITHTSAPRGSECWIHHGWVKALVGGKSAPKGRVQKTEHAHDRCMQRT